MNSPKSRWLLGEKGLHPAPCPGLPMTGLRHTRGKGNFFRHRRGQRSCPGVCRRKKDPFFRIAAAMRTLRGYLTWLGSLLPARILSSASGVSASWSSRGSTSRRVRTSSCRRMTARPPRSPRCSLPHLPQPWRVQTPLPCTAPAEALLISVSCENLPSSFVRFTLTA